MDGGKGEFFVYMVKNGNKNLIFSNNKTLHGSLGTVIDRQITEKNYQQILQLFKDYS